MQCPICNADLIPLDVGSRLEHVNFCIENGPTTTEFDETGRLQAKKIIDPKKQRKICPICDKTFQQLNSHFKTCALKNDVPPNLMLDYWERINKEAKKKFPRDLLDNFVTKCIREGRDGDQVDFARALSLSMAEREPSRSNKPSSTVPINNGELHPDSENTSDSTIATVVSVASNDLNTIPTYESDNQTVSNTNNARNYNQILMQNAAASTSADTSRRPTSRTRAFLRNYRLQLADDVTKQSNVDLRIERELAASNTKRYQDAISKSHRKFVLRDPCSANAAEEEDCIILIQESQSPENSPADETDELRKLFHRARLKIDDNDVELLLVDFEKYSGASMDAPPRRVDESAAAP